MAPVAQVKHMRVIVPEEQLYKYVPVNIKYNRKYKSANESITHYTKPELT
ncbi:hypothetical protein [uncultured Pontibacter sp.]|nr:hypothetical protein [uncultured Pontibacter sp.]